MNLVIFLLQAVLDAAALAICCEAVFRKRSEMKARDGLLFPIILIFCLIPQVKFTANDMVTAALAVQGAALVPADNGIELLFLLVAILLLNSIFWEGRDNGEVLSGTMAVFSLYLFVRCLSVIVWAVWGLEAWLPVGSRVLMVFAVLLLLCTPFGEQLRQLIQEGGAIVWIVSSDAAISLIGLLSVLSFEVERFLTHVWLITVLLLLLLLVNSILLFWHRRRVQERKRIQMIEQYVPIVEELISQVRARQHEFQHRLLAIETAVASADTLEEAQKMVASLTNGLTISANDRELLSCDSKIIAGMLFGKMKQVEAAGIHLEVQLQGAFTKTLVPETEWIEVMGILLDNAIEASPQGSTIYIASRKNGAYMELVVKNPAPALSNTAFMALFRKGYTTKSNREGRGFGLYNLLCSAERYRGKILTRNEQILGENYVVFGVLFP